ncbi:hypothetical protein [Flavobacterium sp. LM4]|uniref:hypothetical protein n=1 Tax=Flavobacterium sp. LM4 TaxID=1938609 RepID=UPI000991FBA1|nr:hypothetical protein [Flavobacterium sp. LM4]OOV20553.1 hypothetical protein BXU10_13465 [Flavobacterium sp. LM4]
MKSIKLLSIFFLLLISCKKKEIYAQEPSKKEQKGAISGTDYSKESLDNLLKCGDYSYMDGYFTVPDNGCIYNPKTSNKLGNVEVYLIPKNRLNENIDFEKEESKVGKLNIDDLKKLYDIYVLIIDKRDLTYNANMDIPYYPKYPHKQSIFKWTNGVWKKILTLNISNDNNNEYNNWKSNVLGNSNIKQSNQDVVLKGDYSIKTKVESVETGEPIEITFYFNFEISQAILSIGTNNSLEAFCEGTYSVTQNKGIFKLIYTGEGTCTSDLEESSFFIKKENNQYYIKSKRFIDFEWHLLNRK